MQDVRRNWKGDAMNKRRVIEREYRRLQGKPELTDRQIEVLAVIRKFTKDKGYSPSVRDIGERLKIDSPNAIQGHLDALCKKGFISKTDGIARSIRIVREPDEDRRDTLLRRIGRLDTTTLGAIVENYCT